MDMRGFTIPFRKAIPSLVVVVVVVLLVGDEVATREAIKSSTRFPLLAPSLL
jgi:hypothetical protein